MKSCVIKKKKETKKKHPDWSLDRKSLLNLGIASSTGALETAGRLVDADELVDAIVLFN